MRYSKISAFVVLSDLSVIS